MSARSPTPADLRGLARGATRAIAVRGFGLALALAAHVLLARAMGAEPYGAFIYVFTWTYFLGLVARLGLDRAHVRFGTVFIASGDLASLSALIRHSFRIASALGLAAAVAMGAVVLSWPWAMSEPLRQTFLVGVLVVPLLAVHNVYEGIAQARKDVVQSAVPEQVLRQGLLGAFVLVAWLAHGPVSAPQAMALYAAAVAVTLVVDWLWYRRSQPAELWRVTPAPVRREWLRYAASVSTAGLIGTWIVQADLVIAGALLGTEAASVYSVAARTANVVAAVGVVSAAVFGPVIVELAADRADLQRYVTAVTRAMVLAASGLALLLWLARDFIFALFGPAFGAAAAPLAILLACHVARECLGPVHTLLNLSGLERAALAVLSLAAIVNLGANFALVAAFGLAGAAVATSVTVVGYSLVFWWLARRRLRIDSSFGLALPPAK